MPEFVKTHWILLASGLAALVGITLAVLGMTRESVIQEMRKRAQLVTDINNLRGGAENNETIEAEKERGRRIEQEYGNVVQTAESINERQPLMEGVFPAPAQLNVPYLFREAYKRRLWELPHTLKAGSLPSEDEIRDEMEIMADQARRRQEEGGEGTEVAAAPGGPVSGGKGNVAPPAGPGGGGKGGLAPPGGGGGKGGLAPPGAAPGGGKGGIPRGGGRTAPQPGPAPPAAEGGPAPAARAAAPQLTGAQAEEARYRAAVKKAHSIRVYASPDTSFHVSPIAYSNEAPRPADMWYAQVSLWVQEDVLSAIARLNDGAAQQLAGKDVDVANLPVKRVESIRVRGYVAPNGTLIEFPVQGQAQAARGGGAAPTVSSFTGRKADDQFDVVRLTLTAMVDERDLLKLIDSVTRTNFYQVVGLEYATVESTDREGYFYGDAPVVRAVLDFEGYMARKIYKAMMPEEVQLALGIVKAEPGKEAPKKK